MKVSELIDVISQFAFGTLATERQRTEYLRCLNLANIDIYLKLRNCKDFASYKEQNVITDADDADGYSYLEFNTRNNTLKAIYNKNQKLHSFDLTTNDRFIINKNQYLSIPSLNKILLGAKEFDTDAEGNKYVSIFYFEKLKKLVEIIDDIDYETDVHIYDDTLEQILILGALYYIYLGSNGQLNKLNTTFSLYKEKLDDILKFYSY